MARVVPVRATDVAGALPDRFWLPSRETLAALEPATWVKIEVVALEGDGGADLRTMRPVWIEVESRGDQELSGRVVDSHVNFAGYREGEELTVRFDQVFDIKKFDAQGEPVLNVERAEHARGKTVLVGMTYVAPDGEVRSQSQHVGRLREIDPDRWLKLESESGKTWTLPPDMGPWEVAPPGNYRLRASGEVIVDPDYLAMWVVEQRD